MKQYYYQENGKTLGPYSRQDILNKKLRPGTYVWYTGLESWVMIEQVPELFSYKSEAKPKLLNLKSLVIISICLIGAIIIAGTIT